MAKQPKEPKLPAVQEIIGPEKAPDLGGPGGEMLHRPTDANKLLVKIMAAGGRPQEEIALVLKISPVTLRKHYREELDSAMATVASMVLGKLYKKISEEETAAILFFCKTRLGMKETVGHEFPNGIPVAGDSSAVTDDRTKELIREVLNDL
jgi:hypothetical protein